MPSFQDSAVLVLLALLLFGPKKLPVLARQLGKLMADFRRASNEFRSQMEEELRISEQADRQKQVAAIEASAPSIADSIPEPEHPHRQSPELDDDSVASYDSEPLIDPSDERSEYDHSHSPELEPSIPAVAEAPPAPLPIATSGEISILPPPTGLPIANSPSQAPTPPHATELETETLHG